ncbi:MAG: hypothetical protein JXD22_12085 [Sedimentisphaerales bacterium]|nr:hypothetical protein [Sedimentisphaerales bacterium]
MQKQRLILGMLAVMVLGSGASACQYSIRDVGFACYPNEHYRFYGYVNNETPAATKEALEQVAYTAFLDSNIKFEIMNVDEKPADYPPLKYLRENNIKEFPAGILLSPLRDKQERSRVIKLVDPAKPIKDSMWDALEEIAVSPVRDKIIADIIKSFGIVLLVESEDKVANELARTYIGEAIANLTKMIPDFPRSMYMPQDVTIGNPVMHAITAQSRQQEAALLWSLELADKPADETLVVVMHGRGRQIGWVLSGDDISTETITNILAVIGQDCECNLPRSWMTGRLIPLRWDEKTRADMVKTLGFNPESPMVLSEISMIIGRGALGPDPGPDNLISASTAPGGYREFAVVFEPAGTEEPEPVEAAGPEATVEPVADSANGAGQVPGGDSVAVVDSAANSPEAAESSTEEVMPVVGSVKPMALIVVLLVFLILVAGLIILVKAQRKNQ